MTNRPSAHSTTPGIPISAIAAAKAINGEAMKENKPTEISVFI